jgi:hypothetical protein
MAEYFSTQDEAEAFIVQMSREPTFFGRVMTPHGKKWIVELTGRDPYQHFSDIENHTERIRQLRAAREPKRGAFTGGLGERYCSQKCYDAGGATITQHLLQGWTGDCSICRGPVRLGVGVARDSGASMVCWKPGHFLFHCGSQSCVAAVRALVQQGDACVVCGSSI